MNRRDFLAQVACAFAVAGIPTARACLPPEDITGFWTRDPSGMDFVDALGAKQKTFFTGDLVMFSEWAGGGFAGYVVGFKKNPWNKFRSGEGDFVGIAYKGNPDEIHPRLSSSLRHATFADFPEMKIYGSIGL